MAEKDEKQGALALSDPGQATGKARGGHARAAALSKSQKISIARKAAQARWAASKPLKAIHRGNFKEHFGFDVDCYVLDDEQHTAVISQRGMGDTLGLRGGGRSLPVLLNARWLEPYGGLELREKVANPLIFQSAMVVSKTTKVQVPVYGYDAVLLIDVCKAIIAADVDGKTTKSQERLVRQAQVIVGASAKAGITGLVYALAGYNATREEVIATFKAFVREEAREYEKEFPDRLYEQWYRLYRIPKPEKNKPWKFMHLTVDQVYVPLARSNGKVLELTRSQKATSGQRSKRLHQFLSEIGVKALRMHLGQLLGIAQISDSKEEYERHVEKVFGRQLTLNI